MKSIVFAGRWVVGWLLVSALAAGCPKPVPGRPVWIYSREHQDFPRERYLVGVGQGSTREQAEKNAGEDLRGQLKVRFAQAWQPAAGHESEGWFDSYRLPPPVPQDVPAPRIALSWGSPESRLHAALAVWELSGIAGPLKKSADAAEQACKSACQRAEKALSQQEPSPALKSYLGALKARADWEAFLAVHRALTKSPREATSLPSLPELSQAIAGLLAAVNLQVVAGDGQRIGSAGGIKESLVVSVRLMDRDPPLPVSDLPILFHPAGKDSPRTRVRSNRLGLAGAELTTGLGPNQKTILAGLDPKGLLEDAGIDPLDPRFAGFEALAGKTAVRFKLLTAGERRLRVMVMLNESIAQEPSADSLLAAELVKELAHSGFEVLTPADLPEAFSALRDPEKLKAAARDHARVLLLGRIEASLSEEITQNFVFARVSGKIELIDLKTGETLFAFEQPAKGAGLDVYSASARALSSFLRKVLPDIIHTLKQMESP